MLNIKKREFLFALLGISLVVIASNSPIFFLDYLIFDDGLLYATYSRGELRENVAKWHLLAPYVEWPVMKLMVEASPGLARFWSVIAYLIPCALCLYTLYRKIWGLSPLASCYAAIVPFITPFQVNIHTSLNNGYPFPTMLAASLAMLTGGLFAISDRYKWSYLFLSAALIIFITLSAPNAPFVMAAISSLFLCLIVAGHKRILFLLAVLLIAIAWAVWHQLDTPRVLSEPFSLQESLERLRYFVSFFSIPIPFSLQIREYFSVYLTTIIMMIIILFVAISTVTSSNGVMDKPAHYDKIKTPTYKLLFLFFCFGWIFATSIPYLTIAPYPYQARYFWLSGFGIAALVPFALQAIPNFRVAGKTGLHTPIFTILILGIASLNFYELETDMVNNNRISTAVRDNLSKHASYPQGSQIVYMSDHCIEHPGVSYSNIGFVWYLLGSQNIKLAQIYPPRFEHYWYNPLKIEKQDWWEPQLTGLKLSRPIFIHKDINKEFRNIPMFLQVKKNDTGQEVWKLYKLDLENGQSKLLVKGEGEDEYLNYLTERYGRADSQDIPRDIAFGFPSNPEEADSKPHDRLYCGQWSPTVVQ